MPFTFSHPAIILPLNKIFKNKFSMTGLVIGSLTPDFEYFIRMKVTSHYSHTLLGNLWFNLPLGIILTFLFHNIIKKSLIENLPSFIQIRLEHLKTFNWIHYFKKQWKTVLISIIIGGYSHLFWDLFTHYNKVSHFLHLNREFLGIPFFKILQHFSTLIGALIITIYFLRKKKTASKTTKIELNYWIKILIVSFLIFGIRVLLGLKIEEYGNVIASLISAFMLSVLIISMIENKKREKRFYI